MSAAAEHLSRILRECASLTLLIESASAEHCHMALARALEEAADDVIRMNP